MIIIRPNPAHFSTNHHHQQQHGNGRFPDPCDGARDAMMLLHRLYQHAVQDEEEKESKQKDGEEQKKVQTRPDNHNQNNSNKANKKAEQEAGTTSAATIEHSNKSNNNPQQLQQSSQMRTYYHRAPVKQTNTKDGVTIALDVPGFDTKTLTVQLEDHILTVTGERKNRIGDKFVLRHSFTVDGSVLNEDNIKASLAEGVLEITIPKKLEPKTKLIPIVEEETSNLNNMLPAEDDKSIETTEEQNDKSKETTAAQDDEEIVVESVSEEEEQEEEATAE